MFDLVCDLFGLLLDLRGLDLGDLFLALLN
jgi:hypothetical protein